MTDLEYIAHLETELAAARADAERRLILGEVRLENIERRIRVLEAQVASLQLAAPRGIPR